MAREEYAWADEMDHVGGFEVGKPNFADQKIAVVADILGEIENPRWQTHARGRGRVRTGRM